MSSPTKKQKKIYESLQGMYKRIENYSDEELNATIAVVADHFGDDFWLILNGIDAYFERRERKRAAEHAEELEFQSL